MEEFPEGFDLAALLAPIAPETPAGSDLRQDDSAEALYFRLRDARREASAAERAADAQRDAGEPAPLNGAPVSAVEQWRIVRELAIEALALRSKDLQIAAWLTEAVLRSDGLSGFAAGCRLMTGLADGFWDELFPQPDEEGIATRVAPVAALNGVGRDGTLIQPLRKLVLFERPTDKTPFYFYQYEQSAEFAAITDAQRRQELLDRNVLPFDIVENEARAAGGAHFGQLRSQIQQAAEAWQTLSQTLDAHAGAEGPPSSAVRDLLEKIRIVANRFAAPEEITASVPATAGVPEVDGAAAGAMPAAGVGGLVSREDAVRALAHIAEFFRKTEPLSPITYTLQEAVRRSRLTWPELLEEIVPDAAARSTILTSLGIRPPPSE